MNLIVTLIIVKAQKRKEKKKASVLTIWEFPPTGRGDPALSWFYGFASISAVPENKNSSF